VAILGLAAYMRADIPFEKRRDFFVYMDEFQIQLPLLQGKSVSLRRNAGAWILISLRFLAHTNMRRGHFHTLSQRRFPRAPLQTRN
jgi:hypothetical protein